MNHKVPCESQDTAGCPTQGVYERIHKVPGQPVYHKAQTILKMGCEREDL